MRPSRREFLAGTASVMTAATVASRPRTARADARPSGLKIGMCDWSIGRLDPSAMALAREIGLDGIEVSVGTRENKMWLRREEVQSEYLQAARDQKIAIPSLAMGELNHVPLMSEPRAAIWVADAIEVARRMKVDKILLAFFSKGELKGNNAEDMRRVIEVLAELAPRAEKSGVVLGVESYLSAEDHLKILDAVKSKSVQVYYDVKNMADAGHDSIAALKTLGAERICQIHFKDTPYLEKGSGKVDWPKTVAAIKEIGYSGWIVLETGKPSGDIVADTKKNVEYVRRLFAA
jgi:sugar phosphate isomerase/epimerase